MNSLIIFSLISFNLSSISILKPPQANEAYITTQFKDDLKSFNDDALWPDHYERMYLNLNQDTFYRSFNHKVSDLHNQTYLRYQVRIFYSNRTYTDTAWTYSIWNKRNFNSCDNNFGTITLLSITCFVLLTSMIIIYLKIKYF